MENDYRPLFPCIPADSYSLIPCTHFELKVAKSIRALGTLISGIAVDPMERLRVSQEGIPMTNSKNTVSLCNLKERKGEHAGNPR